LNLRTKLWKNLLNELPQDSYDLKLKTRTGHSMLFDPKRQELIIIGGNRISKKKNEITSQLFDIIIYDIETKTIKELFHNYSKEKGPDVNFSLNAFFNCEKREIIIFGGGLKSEKQDIVSNNFWILNLNSRKWDKVSKTNMIINYDNIMQEDIKLFFSNRNITHIDFSENNDNQKKIFGRIISSFKDTEKNLNLKENINKKITSILKPNEMLYSLKNYALNLSNSFYKNYNSNECMQLNEPMPRFAHTLIYSAKLNKGYIFGGNPYIKISHCCFRYNDFWTFSLFKPDAFQIKNLLKNKILTLSFIDACDNFALDKALELLKQIKKLENLDQDEIKILFNYILKLDNINNAGAHVYDKEIFLKRYELFDDIRKYFNDND